MHVCGTCRKCGSIVIIQQTGLVHIMRIICFVVILIIIMTILCDCIPHREEVEDLAKQLKLKLFRTSVKEDFNVNEGQSDFAMVCIFILVYLNSF